MTIMDRTRPLSLSHSHTPEQMWGVIPDNILTYISPTPQIIIQIVIFNSSTRYNHSNENYEKDILRQDNIFHDNECKRKISHLIHVTKSYSYEHAGLQY